MSSARDVLLVVRGLSKRFGRQLLFDNLTFGVHHGEFFVVYGPSGCGKTTLLKIIAGLATPETGEVIIGGRSVTNLPPEERRVAMAFQTFALYPHMTAFDNIASPLRSPRSGAHPSEVFRRVREVAELLRIRHVLDRRPGELSGGEKQRVALARAIIRGADVLLLDDPLRNVDAKIRHRMRAELPRILGQLSTTVVYVTQDYREALALGDRIAVLRGGGFVQVATPEEIYNGPADLFVAQSFGEPPINLIPARVGPRGTIEAPFGAFAPASPPMAEPGTEVILGLRPHDIGLSESVFVLAGRVVAFQPLGTRAATVVEVDGGIRLTVSTPPGVSYVFGQRIHLSVDPGKLLLFEARTGIRMPIASGFDVSEKASWRT